MLEEYLPSVLKAVRHDGRSHEIMVVDNGSCDDSVEFLRTRFAGVKVISLPRNLRFTGGNNAGVQAAENDIVILLNNDMEVDEDFIRPLLDGFTDENVFAISCQVYFQDKSRRREETGKTRGRWKMGFLELSHDQITPSDSQQKYVPIFWGGGGSCAFDRRKILAMGGLDTIWDPFYLEDTDLSYQAWKRGWKSLLAVDSVVVHRHRGTNKLKFGDNYVDNTIRKNQYLFIWKNITEVNWTVAHGFFLPLVQARLISNTSFRFELRAFFRALVQLPEALFKRQLGRKNYVISDPAIFEDTSESFPSTGESWIDFSHNDFAEQLGEGWFELEKNGGRYFRWMSRKGALCLYPRGYEQWLEIRGDVPSMDNFSRRSQKLKVFQNGKLIFSKLWFRSEQVLLKIPIRLDSQPRQRFDFKLGSSFCPARLGRGEDQRELGMMFSEFRLV